MNHPPVNDLPEAYRAKAGPPSQSNGFAQTQRLVPVGPSPEEAAARMIINALGTHNVIARTFSFFADVFSQPILNANPSRRGFTIQNVSGSDVYVGIGTQPSVVGSTVIGGILIQNGGFYEPQNSYIPVNDIFVLGVASSQQLNVIELTKVS